MTSKKRTSILITAGPTREYIDPVRYISNDSSGKMGFALAEQAAKLGLDVTLIAGPVNLATPKKVKMINVVSATEMHKAVLKHSKKAEVIIMTAAVADFAPAKFSVHKIKKVEGKAELSLKLKKNPDILRDVCSRKKPKQTVIGFALETKDLIKNAKRKLYEKKCDLIVANLAGSIGSAESKITIITRSGHIARFPALSKTEIAGIILTYVI